MPKRVCVDFDGTLATWGSEGGPFNPAIIKGVPIDGAKEFMDRLRNDGLQVFIHSTRAMSPLGKFAIENWCKKYAINYDGITSSKLAAIAYVDDRGVNFDGNFETVYNKIKELE